MMRGLAVILLCLIVCAGVQCYRLSSTIARIETQKATIAENEKKLSRKNSQLLALNILMQTSSQAQTALYAAAERNGQLLRDRQRETEELKHENENLRLWADTRLPDTAVRLRQRPALTGGESYRQWLSENHPVPPRAVSAAQ